MKRFVMRGAAWAAMALFVLFALFAVDGARAGEGGGAPAPAALDLLLPGGANATASGQADAALAAAGAGVAFVCDGAGGKNRWPGIAVRPQGGKGARWDLRPYGYVEALVENRGERLATVSLRADDASGLILDQAWITTAATIAPGATAAVRLYLADLSYGRRYILQKEAVSQVLLYCGTAANAPGKAPLVLHRLVAGGRAGEVPPGHAPLHVVRGDVALADFAAGGAAPATEAKFQASRARAQARGGALEIVAGAGEPGQAALFPADGGKWHLGFFNQVDFDLENPGEAPLRVVCAVSNRRGLEPGAGARREFTVPAKGKLRASVPFMAASPWRSTVGPDGQPVTDAASERARARGDQGGQELYSDEVAAVGVILPAGGAARLARVAAAVAPPVTLPEWSGQRPPVLGDWRLTLDDDFSGAEVDEKLWNRKMPWVGQPALEPQRYQPKNAFVKDGMLHLRAAREEGYLNDDPSITKVPPGHYTSAVLTSFAKWAQCYGYFEARLKPQKAFGLWPAFWCKPYHGPTLTDIRKDTSGGAAELDIYEHLTRFGFYRYNIAAHWNGYGADHRKTGDSRVYYRTDAEGFVVAGMLWEPGRITWYLNQEPVGVWESPAVPTVPVFLKFTVQMGGWAGYYVEDDKLADEDFLVDYVRVWQKPEWAALASPAPQGGAAPAGAPKDGAP